MEKPGFCFLFFTKALFGSWKKTMDVIYEFP